MEQANLTLGEREFIEQIRDRASISDVQLINMRDILSFHEDGYACFTFLQDGIHDILVETMDIQYKTFDDYRYKGIVLNGQGFSVGELIINRLPQGYSGDFRFGDQAYEMIHLKENLNLLVKKEISVDTDYNCGLGTGQIDSSDNGTSSCSDTTFDPLVVICEEPDPKCYASAKILVLVTPEAKRDIGASGLELYITNLVERTNYALERSEAKTTVHFVVEDDFQWDRTSEISIATDALALSNDDRAIELRDGHDADLVVMLTATYDLNGGSGVTPIVPNCARAYAIVVAEKTGYPGYLFPHEIGHLLGGHHSGDAGNCGQGHIIKTELGPRGIFIANTLMVNDADKKKILNYSNPDVNYLGYPTGRKSDDGENVGEVNNVVGSIDYLSCVITGYKGNEDFIVRIDGPRTICNDSKRYFADTPDFSTGLAPYSYTWRYSLDGVNTSNVIGTSSVLNFAPPPNIPSCQAFFLHVKVTASNEMVTEHTKKIRRLSGACTECLKPNSCRIIPKRKDSFHINPDINIYPNPSKGIVNISWNSDMGDITRIQIFDINGMIVYETTPQSYKGINTQKIDVNLSSGLYHIQLSNDKQIFNQKLIIQN